MYVRMYVCMYVFMRYKPGSTILSVGACFEGMPFTNRRSISNWRMTCMQVYMCNCMRVCAGGYFRSVRLYEHMYVCLCA